jgi:hypothetical protein
MCLTVATYVWNGNLGSGGVSKVLEHVDDEHGALGNLAVDDDWDAVAADQSQSVWALFFDHFV